GSRELAGVGHPHSILQPEAVHALEQEREGLIGARLGNRGIAVDQDLTSWRTFHFRIDQIARGAHARHLRQVAQLLLKKSPIRKAQLDIDRLIAGYRRDRTEEERHRPRDSLRLLLA